MNSSKFKIQSSKLPIIILHGWGLRGGVYQKLKGLLEDGGFKVFIPDLPGFGSEPLRSQTMVFDDYVSFVDEFLKANKIVKPIIIGHSFGGRIALKYAFKYSQKVTKLVLTGAPVIRSSVFKRKISRIVSIAGGQLFRFLPKTTNDFLRKLLYFLIGEWDYYKAGPLKQVFKNIISEDLVFYAKNIKVPVLLVWGENDKVVPVSDMKKIAKIIPQATFSVITDAGHKLPYEKPEIFVKAILPFLL